jgi:hypothetical protein
VCDHTSVLAFIERLWGLEPLTERDADADDLFGILDEKRLTENQPAAPSDLPLIEADKDELYAPECSYDINLRSDENIPQRSVTGQEELEALLDGPLAGSPHDRRADTDAIYEALLAEAERLGVLRRT